MGIEHGHMGPPFVDLHRGIDADLAQVSHRSLGHLFIVQVASARRMEEEVEPFGIPRLGQELLGLFGVIGVGFDLRVIAEMVFGERNPQLDGIAFENLFG